MFASHRLWTMLVLFCFGTGLAFSQLNFKEAFQAQFPFNDNPGGLMIADMDRDGLPDIVAIHAQTLSIFFNQGSGNFSPSHDTALPANSGSLQVLAADVNNDGKTDLVIDQFQPMQILVLLGNGDGTFQPPMIISLANVPAGIALGDLNNDGKVDLAVQECQPNSSACDITVYLGSGTGTFTSNTVLSVPGDFSNFDVVVTDFNKDGKLDIATATLGGSSSSPTYSFSVFFGNGDGSFQSPVVVQVPFTLPANSSAQPPSIVYGDFNGDAVDDIGVEAGSVCGGSACGESQMNIFLSNATGGFTFKGQFESSSAEGTNRWTVGDLNNDFTTDLARFSTAPMTGNTLTWTNDGSGNFTSIGNPFGVPAFAQIRDINLDGLHDFIELDDQTGTIDVQTWMGQNGTPNCPPPDSNVLQAKMCSPGTSTSSTTFTVQGSGNSPVGIKRVELWVDGHKVFQTLNDQLRHTMTLSTGTHTITVVAVDKYIGFAKATRSVNVQ